MSDTQRLDEIRSLAQNVIDGWRDSMPKDVYLALERIVDLATLDPSAIERRLVNDGWLQDVANLWSDGA